MDENSHSEINPEQTPDSSHQKSLSLNPEQTPDPTSPIQKLSESNSISQNVLQTSSVSLNNSKREIFQKLSIPVLNKDTCNSNTYDYRSLLDIKIQKEAQRGHRIKNSQTTKVPKTQQIPSSKKTINSSSCKLLASQQEKNLKIAKMREEKLQNELKECTFAPKILENRKKRTPEEYFKDQMKFEEQKKKKIQDKKQTIIETKEIEISSFSFAPAITEKSAEMASKHVYEEEIYKRLSLGSKPKLKEASLEEGSEEKVSVKEDKNELTFTPALNSRSKNMLRIGSVEDILYEDAKRRQKARKEAKVVYSYEINVNSNSEKLLIEKFYKDFIEVHDQDTANFTEFTGILKNLHMALGLEKNLSKESELSQRLWSKIVTADQPAPSERLLMHLMAIMKYQTSIFTDSTEAISPEETDHLHSSYFLFYKNRTSVINHSNFNRNLKPDPVPAFQPEISENSKKILEDVPKESIIKRREIRKLESILEAEEKCLAECTFQPIVHSTEAKMKTEEIKSPLLKEYINLSTQNTSHRTKALFSFASIEKEKKEDFIKVEREKLEKKKMVDCTFAPNLVKNTSRKKNDRTPGHIAGKKSQDY